MTLPHGEMRCFLLQKELPDVVTRKISRRPSDDVASGARNVGLPFSSRSTTTPVVVPQKNVTSGVWIALQKVDQVPHIYSFFFLPHQQVPFFLCALRA